MEKVYSNILFSDIMHLLCSVYSCPESERDDLYIRIGCFLSICRVSGAIEKGLLLICSITYQPDLLGMQEVCPNQMDDLKLKLPQYQYLRRDED